MERRANLANKLRMKKNRVAKGCTRFILRVI
jgi:hypothetical protein